MTSSRTTSSGGRLINQAEAAVVERIFTMFADGVSPRAIARRLNDERVPGPGRPPVAGHHHPRPEGARHRHPQQRALHRPAGLEPLLVREGPAHRQAGGASQSAGALGARRRCRTCASSTMRSGTRSRRARRRRLRDGPGRRAAMRSTGRTAAASCSAGLLVCGCCGAGYTIMAKDRYGCAGAPLQGHLRQRPHDQPAGDRGADLKASSRTCSRPNWWRSSPAPIRRRSTG